MQADLTDAMKARDDLRMAALRMALAALATEATSGKRARELTDEEVAAVLRREIRRREEAAEAFRSAARVDRESRERAEAQVLAAYLPAELTDGELAALVAAEVARAGAHGVAQLGPVMKALSAQIAGRAPGARVVTEVRRQLEQAP